MIRAVLAVVLAAAILGTTLPVVDRARVDRSEQQVRSELAEFRQRVERLLGTDDAPRVGPGPRRVVTLRLPVRSWTAAPVATVRFRPAPDRPGTTLTWTIEGGVRHRRQLPSLELAVPGTRSLVLSRGGRHRLVARLAGPSHDPVVTVRRFKSENAATRSYVALERQRAI